MANKKISELPYINDSQISGNTLVPLVTYFSAATGDTVHTFVDDFQTYLISGLTGNTDVFVTGGTYSAGTSTFTNNTGGTFTVTGFYTGETSYVNSLTTGAGLSADTTTGDITIINTDPDQVVVLNNGTNINVTGTYPNFTIDVTGLTDFNTFTTGFTYSSNTFTISDNSGNTFDATFTEVTGLTVNGDLNITGTTYSNVISATTYQNLPDNVTGNYLPLSGGTVSGNTIFQSGLTANTISASTLTVNGVNITGDTYVTGLTFNTGNYNLTIGRNDGVSFTDSLSILASDLTVTGGTYDPNTGEATFTNNTGGTFIVTGFLTGFTDTYVTGGTYSNGTATFTNTSGGTFNVSGFYTGGTDVFVTGGTFSAGTITFTNNTGGTFNVTGLTTTQNLSKILFVDPNGNNSTAARGNSNLPYLTLEAAQSAATTGDTIYVFPGTYTVTTTATEGLAKDGVSYYFMPNTTINKSTAGDMFRVNGFTTGFSVLGYGNFNKTGTAASIFYVTTVSSTVNIVFEANDLTTTTSSVIFDIRSTGKCYLNFKNASSTAGSIINLDASTISIDMHSMTTTTSYTFIGSALGQANHFYGCNLTVRGYLIETTSVSGGISTMLIGGNNLVNLTVNYIRTESTGVGITSNAGVNTRINLNVTRINGISGTNITPIATTIYLDGYTDSINGRINVIGGETKIINVQDGEIDTTFSGYFDNSTSGTITISGGKVTLQMENQDPTTGFNISGGDVTLNGTWVNDDMSAPADLTGGVLRMNCDYEYGGPSFAQTRYYGLRVNGGTLILNGTIRVNFPASLGLNSYNSLQASPIVFNSGKIIINGGTLISNISGATAIQTTSSGLSLKVYSGGLNTNLNQNGGVLAGKKMRIKYTVNSVATTTIVLNDGTGGNETFTETDTTTYNTTTLLAQRMVSLINTSGTLDITASQDTPGGDDYFYAESDTANNQYTLVSTTNLTVFAISPGMFSLAQSVLGPIIEDTDIE